MGNSPSSVMGAGLAAHPSISPQLPLGNTPFVSSPDSAGSSAVLKRSSDDATNIKIPGGPSVVITIIPLSIAGLTPVSSVPVISTISDMASLSSTTFTSAVETSLVSSTSTFEPAPAFPTPFSFSQATPSSTTLLSPSTATETINSMISAAPSSSPSPVQSSASETQGTSRVGAGVASPTPASQRTAPFTMKDAVIGEIPSPTVDVPITLVAMAFYIFFAGYVLVRKTLNKRVGHQFVPSNLIFDFCLVRVITTSMRVAWAFVPQNNSIVLAALIFENAGSVVLYAVNIECTQRILRSVHPHFGWHPATSKFFILLLVLVPASIIYNILFASLEFFYDAPATLRLIRDFSFFGYYLGLFLCVFPVVCVPFALLVPSAAPPEPFGKGLLATKVAFLGFVSMLLLIGKFVNVMGIMFLYPADAPGVIDNKILFYVTGFLLEIIVLAMYAFLRVDLMFHVPDKCTGPGQYAARSTPGMMTGDEEQFMADIIGYQRPLDRNTSLPTPQENGLNMREEVLAAMLEIEHMSSFDLKTLMYAVKAKKNARQRMMVRAQSPEVIPPPRQRAHRQRPPMLQTEKVPLRGWEGDYERDLGRDSWRSEVSRDVGFEQRQFGSGPV